MTIQPSGSQRILTGLCIAIISFVTFVIHYQHFCLLEHYYSFGLSANNCIISESSSVTAKTIGTNLNSIAPRSHRPSLLSSSLATTGTMSTTTDNGQLTKDVVEKYLKEDYKAFIFATHPLHGLLLLYCTRKKKKGPHYQAPGGHVDKEDYDHVIAQMSSSSTTVQGPELLMQACKMGAARELFEETGLDFRSTVDR
jgi:hypothetical protein